MLNDDRAAKKAEELLKQTKEKFLASADPYQTLQDLLAVELREAYEKTLILEGELVMLKGTYQGAKAEIARLKEKLNQKDDEYEQQCKHAEAEIARLRESLDRLNDDCLRAEQERDELRAGLQKAAGFKVDRCSCVFIDDEPTLECGYHQTLRAELAKVKP